MIAFYIIICVIIIGLAYCFSETLRFRVTSYDIESPKIDSDIDGLKIILLSDLHCKTFGKDNQKLFERIKQASPDIIIIAGDLINGTPFRKYKAHFRYAENFLRELSELDCPVFYEFGNHEAKIKEYSSNLFHSYIDLVSPLCNLLVNNCISLGSNCNIHGLSLEKKYYYGKTAYRKKKLKISPYVGKADRNKFSILVAHDPSFADKYSRWGADLVLSGHYHGGIVRLPFLGGIISPRYDFFPGIDRGIYKTGNTRMIVSGGLGWHGYPFRFNNLPEIVEITLHSDKQ